MFRAAVMETPGEALKTREFEMYTPEPGGVWLRTILSEVCGTDVHLFHGRLAGVPYPIIPGHINVGAIEHTEGEVRDVDGNVLAPGDVVTFLDVHETCNNCWYCLVAKASTRCPNRKVYGITYGVKDGVLGGWSQMIYLKPGVKIVKLSVAPETFIGGGCGLPTAFHGVERAGIKLGDTVLVQGSGPVGLNAVALARLAGALDVILVGGPEQRLAMGRQFGADATIDVFSTTPEERLRLVRDLTHGRGTDVTIEATGNPAAIPEGMHLTRDAGTYVVLGQYTDNGSVTLNPHLDINKKHLNILGTWGIDFSHFYRAIRVMERHAGSIPWHLIAERRYNLDETTQAIADVEAQRVVKAVIDPQG